MYFVQDYFEDEGFARVMASSRHLTRQRYVSLGSEKTAGSLMQLHQKRQKAKPRIRVKSTHVRDWFVQNFELSKDFGSVNC